MRNLHLLTCNVRSAIHIRFSVKPGSALKWCGTATRCFTSITLANGSSTNCFLHISKFFPLKIKHVTGEKKRSCSSTSCPSRVINLSSVPVLRIHDILVRIRIRGTVPLIKRSGSCFFCHWSSRHQQITSFSQFFCLLLFEGTFTSFFKDKNWQRSHKTVGLGIRVFCNYFCLMIEGSGSVPLWRIIRVQKAQKHADPDPQHWLFHSAYLYFSVAALVLELTPRASLLPSGKSFRWVTCSLS